MKTFKPGRLSFVLEAPFDRSNPLPRLESALVGFTTELRRRGLVCFGSAGWNCRSRSPAVLTLALSEKGSRIGWSGSNGFLAALDCWVGSSSMEFSGDSTSSVMGEEKGKAGTAGGRRCDAAWACGDVKGLSMVPRRAIRRDRLIPKRKEVSKMKEAQDRNPSTDHVC